MLNHDERWHLISYNGKLSFLDTSNVILLMNAELQNIASSHYVYIKLCLLHVEDYEQAVRNSMTEIDRLKIVLQRYQMRRAGSKNNCVIIL